MLRRGTLVLGSVLLETVVLGGLVRLARRAAGRLSALGAFNVGVGAVAGCQWLIERKVDDEGEGEGSRMEWE